MCVIIINLNVTSAHYTAKNVDTKYRFIYLLVIVLQPQNELFIHFVFGYLPLLLLWFHEEIIT